MALPILACFSQDLQASEVSRNGNPNLPIPDSHLIYNQTVVNGKNLVTVRQRYYPNTLDRKDSELVIYNLKTNTSKVIVTNGDHGFGSVRMDNNDVVFINNEDDQTYRYSIKAESLSLAPYLTGYGISNGKGKFCRSEVYDTDYQNGCIDKDTQEISPLAVSFNLPVAADATIITPDATITKYQAVWGNRALVTDYSSPYAVKVFPNIFDGSNHNSVYGQFHSWGVSENINGKNISVHKGFGYFLPDYDSHVHIINMETGRPEVITTNLATANDSYDRVTLMSGYTNENSKSVAIVRSTADDSAEYGNEIGLIRNAGSFALPEDIYNTTKKIGFLGLSANNVVWFELNGSETEDGGVFKAYNIDSDSIVDLRL